MALVKKQNGDYALSIAELQKQQAKKEEEKRRQEQAQKTAAAALATQAQKEEQIAQRKQSTAAAAPAAQTKTAEEQRNALREQKGMEPSRNVSKNTTAEDNRNKLSTAAAAPNAQATTAEERRNALRVQKGMEPSRNVLTNTTAEDKRNKLRESLGLAPSTRAANGNNRQNAAMRLPETGVGLDGDWIKKLNDKTLTEAELRAQLKNATQTVDGFGYLKYDDIFIIGGTPVTIEDLIRQGYPEKFINALVKSVKPQTAAEKLVSGIKNYLSNNTEALEKGMEQEQIDAAKRKVAEYQRQLNAGTFGSNKEREQYRQQFEQELESYYDLLLNAANETYLLEELDQAQKALEKLKKMGSNVVGATGVAAQRIVNERKKEVATLENRIAKLQQMKNARETAAVVEKAQRNGDVELLNELVAAQTASVSDTVYQALNPDVIDTVFQALNPGESPKRKAITLKNKALEKGYTDEEIANYAKYKQQGAYKELFGPYLAWLKQMTSSDKLGDRLAGEAVAGAAQVLSSPVRGVARLAYGLAGAQYGGQFVDPAKMLTDTVRQGTETAVQNILAAHENKDGQPTAWGKTLANIYQWSVSAAESVFDMVTLGPATSVIMGFNAAADNYDDALARGLSKGQAVTLGMTAGVFEALFEYLSLEKIKFWNSTKLTDFKGWLTMWAKSSVVQGTEEMFTDIANLCADFLIAGGMSEYNEAMAEGKTPAQFAGEKAWEIVLDGMGGAFSGGLMGGASQIQQQGMSAITQAFGNYRTGRQIASTGDVTAVIDEAKNSKNAKTRKLGGQLEDAVKNGKDANALAGKVYNRLQNESVSAAAEAAYREKAAARGEKADEQTAKAVGVAAREAAASLRADPQSGRLTYTVSDPGAARAVESGIGREVLDELMGAQEADWAQKTRQSREDFARSTGVLDDAQGRAEIADKNAARLAAEITKAVRGDTEAALVKNGYEGRFNGENGANVTLGDVKGLDEQGRAMVVTDYQSGQETQATASFDRDGGEGTVKSADEDYNILVEDAARNMRGESAGGYGTAYRPTAPVKMSAAAASARIALFSPRVNADAAAYSAWYWDAYQAGKRGMSWEGYLDLYNSKGAGEWSGQITEGQLREAFRVGRMEFAPGKGVTRIGTAVLTNRQAAELRLLDAVTRKLGFSVMVVDDLDGANGYVETGADVAVISLNAQGGLVSVAAFHEITHVLTREMTTAAARRFVGAVLAEYEAQAGAEAFRAGFWETARRYAETEGKTKREAIRRANRLNDAARTDEEKRAADVALLRGLFPARELNDAEAYVREEMAAQYFGAVAAQNMDSLVARVYKNGGARLLAKISDALRRFVDAAKEAFDALAGKDANVRAALKTGGSVEAVERLLERFEKAAMRTMEAREDTLAAQGERIRAEAEGNSGVSEENSGASEEKQHSYKSERGAAAEELTRLADAQKRIADGEDAEQVRRETGWFKGYDGKWRLEIDDSNARLIENPDFQIHYTADGDIYRTALLKDILENAELLDAYPELGGYTIIIQGMEPGTQGASFAKNKQIVLNQELFQRYTRAYSDYLNGGRKQEIAAIENGPEYKAYHKFYDEATEVEDPETWLREEAAARDKFFSSETGKRYYQLVWGKVDIKKYEPGWSKEAKAVLFHELQHAVQHIEGLATGASTRNKDYDRIAGEIEARDAAARVDMTAEERRNTRPDIDRTDVVFAGGGVSYSHISDVRSWDIAWDTDNYSSIKKQLRDHLSEVNEMESVTSVQYDARKGNYKEILDQILKERFGYKITRKEYGTITFDSIAVSKSSNYINNDEEAAAIIASPYILKRGKAISGHLNHKEKGNPSVTFAAPATLNGKIGNVAVSVLYGAKDRVHAIRVLAPNGAEFELVETKKTELTTGGSVKNNVSTPISSAVSTISQYATESQEKNSEPVTYDDDGNVIPLSERFDERREDIRWSRKAEDAREAFAEAAPGRDELGAMLDETGALLKRARAELRELRKNGAAETETSWTPTREAVLEIVRRHNADGATGMTDDALTDKILQAFEDLNAYDFGPDELTAYLWGAMYEKAKAAAMETGDETLNDIRDITGEKTYAVDDETLNRLAEATGASKSFVAAELRRNYGFRVTTESKAGENAVPFKQDAATIAETVGNRFDGVEEEREAKRGDPYGVLLGLYQISGSMTRDVRTTEQTEDDVYAAAMLEATEMADELIRATPIRTMADEYVRKINELKEAYRGDIAKRDAAIAEMAEEIGKVRAKTKYIVKQRQRDMERRRDAEQRKRVIESIEKRAKWFNDRMTNPSQRKHIPFPLRDALEPMIDYFITDARNRREANAMAPREPEKAADYRQPDYMQYQAEEKERRKEVYTAEQISRIIMWYDALNDEKNSADGLDASSRLYYGLYNEEVQEKLQEFYTLVSNREQYEAGLSERETKALAGGKKADRMSLLELKDLRDVLAAIQHLIVRADSVFVQGKRESYTEAGTKLWDYVASQRKNGRAAEWRRTAQNNKINVGMLKPTYLFREVIGGELTKYFDDLREGQNRYAFRLTAARDALVELDEKYGRQKWFRETETFTLSSGVTLTLDKDAVMQIYATHRREAMSVQETAHLLGSGIELSDRILQINKKASREQYELLKQMTEIRLTEEDLAAIIGTLTEQQKDFADAVVRYMSTVCSAWGNEVTRELAGFDNYTEPYYFPYAISGNYLYQKVGQQQDIRMKNRGFAHALKPGASKTIALTGFMDIAGKHIGAMASYSTLTVPLENLQRVRNFTPEGEKASVHTVINNVYGEEIAQYITRFLNDMNGNVRAEQKDGWDRFVGIFKRSAVGLNASVVIQQYSAIARAMWLVNPKYFVPHMRMWREYKELKRYSGVAIIKELGGWDVNTGRSTVDYLTRNDGETGLQRLNNRLDDFTGFMAGKVDEITWSQIWNAVKRETADKMGVKYRRGGMSEEFYRKAAERFNLVVDYTQVYDSTISRSQAMRSMDGAKKMLTAFLAEPTTTYNMLVFSGKGKIGGRAPAIAAFIGNVLLNEMLKSIVKATRSKDDKPWIERFLEEYLDAVLGEDVPKLAQIFNVDKSNAAVRVLGHLMTSEFNVFNMIYGVKDIISIFQGFDVERSDMTPFTELKDGIQRTTKLLGEMGEDADALTAADALMPLLTTLSGFTHLPLKSAYKDFWLATKYAMQRKGHAATFEGLKNFVGEVWGDMRQAGQELSAEEDFAAKLNVILAATGYGNIANDLKNMLAQFWNGEWDANEALYYAVIQKDAAALERYVKVTPEDVAKYMDEANDEFTARAHAEDVKQKAFHDKVQEALKQMDTRVEDAARALLRYDPAEEMRLEDAIVADGFDRNDVVKAITEMRNALEPPKTWEASKQKTSYAVDFDMLRGVYDDGAPDKAAAVRDALHGQGYTDKQINEQIAEAINDDFVTGEKDLAATRENYRQYTTYTDEEIRNKLINKVPELYANGGMSYDEAREMYLALGVKEDKAKEKIGKLVAADYADGKIQDKDAAVDAYMRQTGETDRQTAGIRFDYYDAKAQNELYPLEYDQYAAYVGSGLKDEGVTPETYAKYQADTAGIDANTTSDGWKRYEAGGGKLTAKQWHICQIIDATFETKAQKDAAWYAEGWKEKNLKYAPWN